ncbi:hypothetical protein D3C79_1123000 [compost metagenome]
MCQVADHAETSAETLQRQPEAKRVQASGQLLEGRLVGQLLFADLERQPRAQRRMLA